MPTRNILNKEEDLIHLPLRTTRAKTKVCRHPFMFEYMLLFFDILVAHLILLFFYNFAPLTNYSIEEHKTKHKFMIILCQCGNPLGTREQNYSIFKKYLCAFRCMIISGEAKMCFYSIAINRMCQ